MLLYLARPYCKFCKAKIEICVFLSKLLNTPAFVRNFTNTACEAKMLEKLRPKAKHFFMSAWCKAHFKAFFDWRSPTIHWASETAVCTKTIRSMQASHWNLPFSYCSHFVPNPLSFCMILQMHLYRAKKNPKSFFQNILGIIS